MQAPKRCHFSWVGMSAIWLCLAPIRPPTLFFFIYSSTCVFFGVTCDFAKLGLSWLIELNVGRGINIVYSCKTLGKSEPLIALILLCRHYRACFPIKMQFCFTEKQNNSAERYRGNMSAHPTGAFNTVPSWKQIMLTLLIVSHCLRNLNFDERNVRI